VPRHRNRDHAPVTLAIFWGGLGAFSLVIGAMVAASRPPGHRALGLIMGFGSGVLISALAFELVSKAADQVDGPRSISLGLLIGCLVFTAGDLLIERWERGKSGGLTSGAGTDIVGEHGSTPGLGILLGALLDGIPECLVLGLTVLETGQVGIGMLVAVFISNLPEGIAATSGLLADGWTRTRIYGLWMAIVIACALASGLGYVLLTGAEPWVLSLIFSFAAGAILTMLATAMMPAAYRNAGRAVGVATVIGFSVAYVVEWIAG
jgi:zinc transporter, ZIP family